MLKQAHKFNKEFNDMIGTDIILLVIRADLRPGFPQLLHLLARSAAFRLISFSGCSDRQLPPKRIPQRYPQLVDRIW